MGCFDRNSDRSSKHRRSNQGTVGLAAGVLLPLLFGATLLAPSPEPFLKTALTRIPATNHASVDTKISRRNDPGHKDVIVQMFQANWDSVGYECEHWLSKAGFGWVQVSPPSEHITGRSGQPTEWWTDYQPVSYKIVSKRGNREQFARMVARCNASGVRVIVDAVINHMTGTRGSPGSGVARSPFEHFWYPGVYSSLDFHRCRKSGDYEIRSYKSRYEVHNCELLGLADLATESDYVRARLAAYLKDLVSLGVSGFRIDSAKHIPSEDIGAILEKVKAPSFVVQEMPFGQGEPILPEEYVSNGHVHEFRGAFDLKAAFQGRGISSLLLNWGKTWVPSDRAATFVVNHDTERQGTTLNFKSSANAHQLATIFLLAHPYGAPSILSSYEFQTDSQGPPQDPTGLTRDVVCDEGTWRCEHREPALMNLVKFRNAAGRLPLTGSISEGNNRIGFGRGNVGTVLINNEDDAWVVRAPTLLPDGDYCDLIHDSNLSPSFCDSFTIRVQGSRVNVVVPPRGALAFYTGAKGGNGSDTSSVPRRRAITRAGITIEVPGGTGRVVAMVGAPASLGSWDPSRGLALVIQPDGKHWTLPSPLQLSDTLEFKFVSIDSSGEVVWEHGPNRVLSPMGEGFVEQMFEFVWRSTPLRAPAILPFDPLPLGHTPPPNLHIQ
ncbi:alpha-amylase-domain-containing protein [Meredithblackwellia eburnea MCA 4105]